MKTWRVIGFGAEGMTSRHWQADDAAHAEEQHRKAFPQEDFVAAHEDLQWRTYDCTYGRHALVLNCGEDGPAYGRVDVAQLAFVGNPVFMPESYVPRHAK